MGAKEHYDSLLADHYSWMLGDFEEQVWQQRKFFDQIGLKEGSGQLAIDLGAGTGIQSVALAQNNFSVIAVDFCEKLLKDFRKRSIHTTISFSCCNILDFLHDFKGTANLITCMGDTITHLQNIDEVSELIRLSSPHP